MAAYTKSLWLPIFVALVLCILLSSTAEAGRPFLKSKTAEETAGRAIERFFDGLALGGIKNSGPSPGVGHSFVTGTHQ
ncbi:PAMP-induced secreted peptide 2 [Linum grandiflorum]